MKPLPLFFLARSRGLLGVVLGCAVASAADPPVPAASEPTQTDRAGSRAAAEPTGNQPDDTPQPARMPDAGEDLPEPTRGARPDYGSFRIVTERNIFNANRSGGTIRPSRDTRAPARVEALRLVGIMDYDRGSFAFFDGTSSEYRTALQAAGVIAGHTLTQITAEGVTLAADDRSYELRVGSQLRREDGGEWRVVVSDEMPAVSGGSAPPSEDGGGDSGELSEVLKKLMQQREQE